MSTCNQLGSLGISLFFSSGAEARSPRELSLLSGDHNLFIFRKKCIVRHCGKKEKLNWMFDVSPIP
jgi:hypothetical protein